MKHTENFSCCIIGQGKLTIDCGRQLMAHGNAIRGVVSANSDVREWATSHNIPTIDTDEDQVAFLGQWKFDVLFSIINPNKVSSFVLQLPKRLAINFHDAPLPRYAGLHVTSWAIINREKYFGVTWHEMTEQFDAGGILKQTEFPIEPEDTAFSLNVKCFQKGSELFSELIDELDDGRETLRTQDLSLRSAFLSSKRPDAAAIIDWNVSGEAIEAMVRALSYQPDPNPLGLPKVLIAGQYFLLIEAELTDRSDSSGPGTVHKINTDSIDVVTGSSLLTLKSLLSVDGERVDVSQLVDMTKLKEGDVLPSLALPDREGIHALDHRFGKREAYWRDRLLSVEPYNFDYHSDSLDANGMPIIIADAFADDMYERLLRFFPEQGFSETVIALFCCFLRRIGDQEVFDLGVNFSDDITQTNLFSALVPFRVSIEKTDSIRSIVAGVHDSLTELRECETFSRDLYARVPGLSCPQWPMVVELLDDFEKSQIDDNSMSAFALKKNGNQFQWRLSSEIFNVEAANQLLKSFRVFIESACVDIDAGLADIALVSPQEREKLLVDWNQTQKDFDQNACIHHLFEKQVALHADDGAVAYRDLELSYGELDRQADVVALTLQQLGVRSDDRIGIFIDRSIDMVIGLLGILKSGAAYVPLDPAYPRDRIALMISDADLPVLLTHSTLERELPPNTANVVCIDQVLDESDSVTLENLNRQCASADNLAYVIYTSGSTGKPKGVMIEHRNVINFFAGMDDTLNFQGDPGVWLAVTSISFDISVLEIFWSLCRGFKVVVQEESARTLPQDSVSRVQRKMDVGLFYFSSDAGPSSNTNRYQALLEGAKFADANHFSTVWTPERHFHLFGGLYPNPSVTSAAIAAVTSNVNIRAGSIVLPLHNPVRVAEEWSVVDNLSGGRVGFSFASGWHANDFSLWPENYDNRKQIMYDNIEVVRKLWAGDEITMNNGEGKPFTARIYPAPIQKNPPIWITTAGNIDSFRRAGEGGFNILTNLLGQSIEEIKGKISAYREGRRSKGHRGEGNVSVMVHTFVGTDVEEVREIVREPFCNYLKTSFDLVKIAPWAFPAFRQPSKNAAQDPTFDADSLTDEDLDALLDHAFDRYFETAGIFGTAVSCLPLIDELKKAGVDEVACLIDFGVDDALVLENLKYLNKLRELANPSTDSAEKSSEQDFSIEAQIQRHKVTHFQCTPSMARILSADPATLAALKTVKKLLLGGEALPVDLANTIKQSLSGELINVYGPTETTIWSTSTDVSANVCNLTIGRPIANTQIYILDNSLQPTAIGIPGELFIGGAGVVRGYLGRPELTAERFIANPFVSDQQARIYRTGDLVRYRENGEVEYLGRLDYQVKLRGYRIELGEIESLICADASVRDCVVIVPEAEQGVESLVAYVVPGLDTEADGEVSQEQSTGHWQTLWDETYRAGTHTVQGEQSEQTGDPTLNISGWLNSYTGAQHPEQHMREWVTATADRILALKPRRVLEIGCGTGMVLYRVAPHCEHYVGVDFSEHALSLIQSQISAFGWDNVQLVQNAADSLALIDSEPFDLVVINSVIQYFPSADYLLNVLKQVSGLVAEQGRLFIGDVRSLSLMECFHHSLELAKAPASLSLPELQERIKERKQNESELVLDPDFFFALQHHIPQLRIGSINVQLKRGNQHNEMSMFRYDVCLTLGPTVDVLNDSDFAVLETPDTLDGLQQYLDDQSQCFVVRDIANTRVDKHLYAESLIRSPAAMVTVSDIHAGVAARGSKGIDPEHVYQQASSWRVELTWARSGRNGCYDAYFIAPNNTMALNLLSDNTFKPLSHYYFEPALYSEEYVLTERLREALREKLPEFMVPNEFMMLDALPLTPNGKIDRKALPKPERRQREAKEAFVAPESDIEQAIASVLQEMLNIEKIGAKDNFSDLGANSLLIVQANNRLSQKIDRKVSLVSMYRYPTIASLAEFLSGNADSKQGLEKGQQRGGKRKAAQAGRKQRLASRRKKTV